MKKEILLERLKQIRLNPRSEVDNLLRRLIYDLTVEKTFPRMMMVSNDNVNWEKAFIIAVTSEVFISDCYIQGFYFKSFRYAKEIDEHTTTLSELEQAYINLGEQIKRLKNE